MRWHGSDRWPRDDRLIKPLLLLLVAAALTGTAPARQAEPGAAERIRADVAFLADDLLEGRETGTRGHAVAAAYVAAQFRAIGLTPAGEARGWYQHVPFRSASTVGVPKLVLTAGGRRKSLRSGVDAAVRPSLLEQHRNLEAPLVFVGYGLKDQRYGLDDFRSLDMRGKIAVVLEGVPAELPTDVGAHLSSWKEHLIAASGAIGSITISRSARDNPQALTSAVSTPVVDWVDAKGRAGSASPLLRVRLSVSEETAQRLFAGARLSLDAVRRQATGAGQPASFDLPARLAIKAGSRWQQFTSPAVLGLLPGSDPRLRDEYVVLMGHLDHLGVKRDAKPGEDAIYNGALDNAAGVATMLEAAREFVASAKKPRRSILFIANTGEEKGLLGADYFAAHPTVPIGQIVAAVDLDMPVPLYDFNDVIAFGADHSTVAQTVAAAGRALGMTVSPDPMPQQSIFVRSDHYRFVVRGIPAILLFTGYGNGGKAAWDHFFASIYHTPKDDLSQPINWAAAARYAQLNYRIGAALANNPQRPRWYRGNYFGDLFAPGQPRAEPKVDFARSSP